MDEIDALVADLPDEIVEFIGELQASNETLSKSLEDATEALEAEVDPDMDPIEKAMSTLDEESAAAITERLEQLDALEGKIAKAELDSADAEYVAKARAFDGLGDPDEIGPALRRLAEAYPEDAELFVKAFTAAAEQVAEGDLYAEIGHSIAKTGDAETEIETIAKSMQSANPELSEADARAQAWEANPSLYEEYTAEKQSQQRH